MALDVYFRDDIRQGIVAVAVAMLSTAIAHGGSNTEYCRGILDTSRAQALNYGMPWTDILVDLRLALTQAGRSDLLELLSEALPASTIVR